MNFRNVLVALACVALFAGLASAQGQQLASVPCTVTAAQSPTVRSEGVTERVGDVLITCGTSATSATPGPVTRGNLLVDFGAPITSRADATAANIGKASEILLLINDPTGVAGSGPVAQYGQNSSLSVCTLGDSYTDVTSVTTGLGNLAAAAKCPAFLQDTAGAGNQTYWELDSTGAATAHPCVVGTSCGGGQAKNAYQGGIGGSTSSITIAWTANQVMFFNVPIYPTFNSSQQNFLRIVNARVNPGSNATITATFTPTTLSAAGGNGFVAGSVYSYAFTGSPVVASVASGLTASVNAIQGVSLCSGTALTPTTTLGKSNLAILTFKENFAGAFKTRVLPLTGNVAGEAQGAGAGQLKPTGSYSATAGTTTVTMQATSSESDFVTSAITPGGVAAGLANTGTRLKAVFKNLDANTKYYVSINPVVDYTTGVTVSTANPLGGAFQPGDVTPVGWAVLQKKGTNDAAVKADETAAFDPVTTNNGIAFGSGPAVAQLFLDKQTDGTYSAEAVWEVTNAAPGTPQTLNFALYGVFSISSPSTTPTVSNAATVQLGFAPTTGTSGAAATTIPRFNAPAAGVKFDNILPCQTSLLFPFLTTAAGFETGIAISNTSTDPYSTPTSHGVCNLNFYGNTGTAVYTPASQLATGDIATGTTYANVTSALAGPNFTGYMIATCNFQFAHGFAFLQSGTGTSQAFMGYVAEVLSTNGGSARGQAFLGESLGQ